MRTKENWYVKPVTERDLIDLLEQHGIQTAGWGISPIHSLEKLLKTLQKCHVHFELPHDGGPDRLTLHVYPAVVTVWYMGSPMRELYEHEQIFPDGRRFSRNGTFDGLGETLNFDLPTNIAESAEEGAHRLLKEELGQSQPLFGERVRYTLFRKMSEVKGPIPHDKWPIQAYFHRKKFGCELPQGSALYLPDGYIEYEQPEDGGRMIVFKWKDI